MQYCRKRIFSVYVEQTKEIGGVKRCILFNFWGRNEITLLKVNCKIIRISMKLAMNRVLIKYIEI